MATKQLCSCLDPEVWQVLQAALTEREDDISRIRKRVSSAFNLVPGAIDAKSKITEELDGMEGRVKEALSRLAETPKCGEAPSMETKKPTSPKTTKTKKTSKKEQ